MNYLLACLVLVVLADQPLTGAGQQTVQTCFVGAPGDLERCLLDHRATDIVVERNYAVEATLNDRSLPINRNVTLRGPANSSPDERPVLDLKFVDGAVQLCASCVFTLRDLVLANDRLGTGPAYDFFTGKPGSRLRSIDTYRLRVACTPGEQQLKAVLAQQRSRLFPNPTAAQDIVLKDVTYKGKLYAGSVWSNNISLDIPYKYDEGGSSAGSHMGGYALNNKNSTRLCEQYVSSACLAEHSADTCIQELVESIVGRPAAKPGMPASTAVAITVPVVMGFMLAGGFAAWWLRRRCMQGSAAKGAAKGPDGQQQPPRKSGPRGRLLTAHSTGASGDSSSSSESKRPGSRSLSKPLARTTGWEVVDTQTAPSMGLVEDAGIELGAFIGAGSYGKVFKARWNGMDVAVKVIEHSGTSAAAVQQEMELMMSFQHPHIVRAYHCIHYMHSSDARLDSECSGSLASHYNTAGSLSPSRQNSGAVPSGVSFSHHAPAVSCSAVTATNSSSSMAFTPSAAAAGAASLTRQHSPLCTASSRGATAAAASGGSSSSTCGCPAALGDAAPTIAEGAPSCRGQPGACQRTGSSSSSSPTKVHFALQTSSSAEQALQPPGSRPQLPALDSLGSSVDCQCVAGIAGAMGSADAGSLRRTKSWKEPAKRYESWLVLEWCDQGCVSSYLADKPTPYEAPQDPDSMLRVLQLLQDTARGLEELHRQQVVHGDLNARNVLVASCNDAPSGVQAKLADLGLSRSIKQHQTHRTTNTIGTMSHMSPEMLRSGQMSVSADIYALAIMMWEMYTGEDAFEGLQHPGQFFETVVLHNLRPVIPQGMPASYQLLMQHCWATELSARPTITRVLECLDYMVREKQQAAAGGNAPEGGAASDPLPHLLANPPQRKAHWWQSQHLRRASLLRAMGSEASVSQAASPPSQASSGILPSFSLPWALGSPPNSNTSLPVIDVEQPADTSLPHDTSQQPLSQQQRRRSKFGARAPAQQHVPQGYASQPLPAVVPDAPHRDSFSFFRAASFRRQQGPADAGQVVSREASLADSASRSNSSSARLPSFLAGLRQGSIGLRLGSFERDPSWSTSRAGSQPGMGDHAWFV